jgi:hypothetical protein
MKIDQLETLFTPLVPKLFKFAFGICPDSQKARQLIADSYSVFIAREIDFIKETEFTKVRKTQSILKRFLLHGVLAEIYKLAGKRSYEIKPYLLDVQTEYQSFYSLSLSQRAITVLKERLKLTPKEIIEIVSLEKYQVIQSMYNAKESMVGMEVSGGESATH